MKLKIASAILALVYAGYLVSNLLVIKELTSSQDECAQATLEALQHSDVTNQAKTAAKVEAGCARLLSNGQLADKVMTAIQ